MECIVLINIDWMISLIFCLLSSDHVRNMRSVLSITLDSFQESLGDTFRIIIFAKSNLSFLVVDKHVEPNLIICQLALSLPW